MYSGNTIDISFDNFMRIDLTLAYIETFNNIMVLEVDSFA
jgi:hypothetical protein